MTKNQRVRLIKAFADVKRCMQQALWQGKLTQGEFFVLRRIKIENEGQADSIGAFKAVRISEHLSMPPPAVTRILNSLENQGLIERKINQQNRRSLLIFLTEKGKILLEKAEASIGNFFDSMAHSLGEDNACNLLDLLEKVVDFCQSSTMHEN